MELRSKLLKTVKTYISKENENRIKKIKNKIKKIKNKIKKMKIRSKK